MIETETKMCTGCDTEKLVDAFCPRNSKGIIPTPCKECRNERKRQEYQRNKQKYKDREKRKYEERKEKHKDFDPFAAGGTKRCPDKDCQLILPVTDFYRVPGNVDCLDQYCKFCSRSKSSAYKSGKDGVGFKINAKQYWKIYEDQNGVCRGCKQPEIHGKSLAIDHNHRTGEVRGLLCFRCNKILGSVDDDFELLERLAKYGKGKLND